ncbi:hypothetical protein [Nocardia amamiensis]|uniref:hypothetical protein n=1 Tax=Nocardia amamiensis TaxID=404578 RepID=UPI00083660EB|nr:hypothetical protein [Nocardia amamiensis]
MKHPDELFRHLRTLPPADIEQWLQKGEWPAGFNWRGLAEVAEFETFHGDPTTALEWAQVVLFVRNQLARTAVGRFERQRQITDAMRLRAELINRLGHVAGDPLLDCEEIFRWFFSRHANQFEEAAADTSHWRDLPIDRIRELRQIKGELNVLRRLDHCAAASSDEASRWFSLWQHLP